MKLALDTSLFVYAMTREHTMRESSRELFSLLPKRGIRPDVSVELLREYVQLRTSGGVTRTQALSESNSVVALCNVHALTPELMQHSLRLFNDIPALDVFDAIHAATALNNLVDAIVSTDPVFDSVEGLYRIEPHEAVSALSH